ncbi:recombinase family protein [Microbacterium arborescens]|uniref:recombinase family protein n=1 Tax=Microbacterium arborescens TaxID=33883 RepID=UPI00278275D8|nr:recombinase family protein [Microbacterium arborescens]MDQ1218147.1 DNA invertase Pin-like site-specific DNA recombinase [Microbacterium arborescens]
MSIVGYARVFKREQNPAAQEAELCAAGASRVFVDHGESSRIADRPQWLACLDYLREGDTLLVRRLGRLGGTERIIIATLHDLDRRRVHIKSLTEPMIYTTTPMGRALFGMVAVFAQLRVDTIRENTMRGLAHAKAQGRVGGRPSKMTPEKVAQAQRMRAEGCSLDHIAAVLSVGKSTVARALVKADHISRADTPGRALS